METNEEYLKQLLVNLGKPIEPSWRVQQFSERKNEASLLAYIDARDTMSQMDLYCKYGWERRHVSIGGELFCELGVVMPDGTRQWRADVGTAAHTEKEKSTASDSFKRAAINWNVGRFLYDMKLVKVPTNIKLDKKDKDCKPYVVDFNGQRVWDLNKFVNQAIKDGKIVIEDVTTVAATAEANQAKPTPAKEDKKPSALQPSAEFDNPPIKLDARKTKALAEFEKLDASKVLAYLIKNGYKYSSNREFIEKETIDKINDVFAQVKAFKKL